MSPHHRADDPIGQQIDGVPPALGHDQLLHVVEMVDLEETDPASKLVGPHVLELTLLGPPAREGELDHRIAIGRWTEIPGRVPHRGPPRTGRYPEEREAVLHVCGHGDGTLGVGDPGQCTARRGDVGIGPGVHDAGECRVGAMSTPSMPYRRLGRAGLKVSVLSFGSWVTFGPQVGVDEAAECFTVAREAGVNFFDNAEAYAGGESERIMGRAFAELGWERHSYVVSTKVFWGIHDDVNMSNTLNRKYLMHAIDGSLERFGLDFVDVLYCHRADPETPIEETVRAMHDIIDAGKALYWGTSEWAADEIQAAWDLAERHHLHKPVVEQPQYNLLERRRVEKEYARLYDDIGLGLTTWSPLASGILTGKYLDGIPDGSRGSLEGYEWMRDYLTSDRYRDGVRALQAIADELDCSAAQLSIAWCARNPRVSSVILGASRVGQLRENLGALGVLDRLDDDVVQRIESATRV